jgi:uncharacterized membrane protein YfcA
VYQHIDLRILSAVVGALILVITWVKLPTPAGASHFSLVLLGAYQTGLGMITGATGPLGAAVLMQHDQRREWIVINTAVYMSISHGLRLGAFAFLGFVFTPYLLLLAGMIVAVTVGSWMGTRLRQYVSATDFLFWFRILVSLLALRMIAAAMLPYI